MNLIFNVNDKKASLFKKYEAILLFGNNLNENMNKCSKIYICNNEKIIAECTFEEVKEIKHSKLGVTNFIVFWADKIKKDKKLVEDLELALKFNLPGYDKSLNLSYMYNLWCLDTLKNTGNMPMLIYLSQEEFHSYIKNQDKADEIIEECDKWLDSLGFYNENDESFFKKYIAISNIIVYNKYKELSDFKNKNNETILTPPKNWCYTLN